MHQPKEKIGIRLFSGFTRLFHWVMVVCVLVLFFTGLYIGDPGYNSLVGEEPTYAVNSLLSMSLIRKIHFITAYVLTISVLLKIYGWIINPADRLMPRFHKKKFWEGLVWGVKHYLFMPHEERPYLRNSLARFSYFLIYVALILIIITGFSMLAMIDPTSIWGKLFLPINLLFTEYQIHQIHHILAWIFIVFMVVHMYMAFRSDYMEQDGEISSMISGYKFFDHRPYDAEDVPAVDQVFPLEEGHKKKPKLKKAHKKKLIKPKDEPNLELKKQESSKEINA